jgi:hypothetical protein
VGPEIEATRDPLPQDKPRPTGVQPSRDMVRIRTLRAAGPPAAAVILSTAIVILLALGTTDEQAIALGLPASLLFIGVVLIASGQDQAVGQRISYLSGFWAGVLLSRSRSAIRNGRSRQ